MRLNLSQQYIDNLKQIGLDLNMILELANLPDTTWKEEMNLSTLDYYHLLTAFDKVANDEQIIAMSRIKDIQMFMPPFFAALSSKNGLAAIEHFAKYKKITGPTRGDAIYLRRSQSCSVWLSCRENGRQ